MTRNYQIPIIVSAWLGLTGCIMPPRGVETPPIPSLEEVAAHKVRVNQVGYFPHQQKFAVYESDAAAPLTWTLRDQANKTVASGQTLPLGRDADSGDPVHLIDFSSFTDSGNGFVMEVQQEKSVPFDIRIDIYTPLRRDAVRYFYMNRSGIGLEMPYVEDKKAERGPGHLSDRAAACERGQKCNYRKDVSGGWYDAGDYGKYVVNGGFSVWMLMHIYETLYMTDGPNTQPANLNIPESGNDVPDILDEARWEMAWILKMQVNDPEAEMDGMVHHRVRNAQFTALGHPPPRTNSDPPRYLRDVSTSASLNLAAAGALCARVFKPFDADFADRCLESAEKAFSAARMWPNEQAVGTGFVPYQDSEFDDDFYWAAAELWVSTGKETYLNFVNRSEHRKQMFHKAGGSTSAFNWADTAGLGTVALAMAKRTDVGNVIGESQAQLVGFASTILELTEKQGYRFPLEKRVYPWGSNSFVVNNAIVLALAHRITGDDKYLDGAIVAMDYILGRNPNDYSYVSGYGTRSMQHPHHRFFAPMYDHRLPFIPPGALSGGPNTNLQDSVSRSYRAGCPPAKCYVDHIEAFATNEVAINWNAALAWIAAYIDDAVK